MSSKSLTRKLGLDQYGSDSGTDDSDQEITKVHRTGGFEDPGVEPFRGKNSEKQGRTGDSRTGREGEVSQVEMIQSAKPPHSVGFEQNESSGMDVNKILQGGTKVDTDITNKLSHGQNHVETLSTSQNSSVKNEKVSDFKISGVRECSSSAPHKSQDRSNARTSRSRQRSRTPERRKRSRSREDQYSSRRSRDYYSSKSKRRSRSRERKRSNSRRRSRDRRRSVSRRRSRSNDRKFSGNKRNDRESSKDRRK